MSGYQNNYDLLITKLDRFIRKFYLNRLIRGVLYTIGLILASFLLIAVLEYFFYFSTSMRKLLFFGFLSLSVVAFGFWVLLPLLNYFRLGKVISHQRAAQVIGDHFTDVKDKLLNVLQLKSLATESNASGLIEASIEQKIEGIKLVPFSSAINLGKNRQYLKYALIPILFFAVILFAAPNLIPSSAERLLNNNTEYEKEAPFRFEVLNEKLEVVQYDDLLLEVKADGDFLPEEAFVLVNDFPYKLRKNGASEFSYRFNKIQKSTSFVIEANGFQSKKYEINVIPKPAIVDFEVELDYPSYLPNKDEVLTNTGDLNIPAGTEINWRFKAQHTDAVQLRFSNEQQLVDSEKKGADLYTLNKKIYKDNTYTIYVSNQRLPNADSITYVMKVIPDLHPVISVKEIRDSSDKKQIYFLGEASDDYGIRKINFKYKVEGEGQSKDSYESTPISVNGKTTTGYSHFWNLNEVELEAGDKLTYFFEVWDNDGVNGSKYARTQMMSYELPTLEEMDAEADLESEQLKEDMMKTAKEAEELKEQIRDIKEELIQKEELDWEDRKKIEDLLNKHKKLENSIENVQKKFDENLKHQQEFKEFTESVMEKQEKLKEMMDELMTPELEELMEKLEDMMEEMNAEELMEELEEFEMTDEELERELDRMMELMKQLEMEQKMTEMIEELQELAEEQEELAEETEQKEDGEDLKEQEEKQEEINEKFEELKEDLEELEKLNEELGHDEEGMEENKEKSEEISEDMEESSEQLEQDQKQKASEKQKDAAEKMQEMASGMQMQMNQMMEEQMGEDMQAIRQLLENLISMSFDQEEVMDKIQGTTVNNPNYVDMVQEQYKLKDDFEIIEDSLVALSKRVFQIESFVLKELTNVNKHFDEGLDHLEERQIPRASVNQQYVMTSVNNLALMLSETLEQMQQQMSGMMEGSQMCNNPGKNPGMKGLGKLQKQLNQQLEEMMKGMQGSKPGEDGKKGKEGKDGKSGMSKEMAKTAAKQAAIREALKEMNQNENKDGKGSMGDLEKLMEEMEKTEKDIVNKQITQELINRQKDILEKLLDAEKAQRERELDNKREAQTADEIVKKIPPEIAEYLKKRDAEIDLYKTVPPSLKPYYRTLVEKYFKQISF